MNTQFDYAQFVQDKLESHPVGRTTDALESALPTGTDPDQLQDALNRLEEQSTIQQIGQKWRWMQYDR